MLEYLHTQKLTVLATRVGERVAHRRAIGEGAIVSEFGKDAQAMAEMEALMKELTP